MSNILEKLTFKFLVGQMIPGFVLALAIEFRLDAGSGGALQIGSFIEYVRGRLSEMNDLRNVGVVILFSVFLGLILQGLSELMAANIESFRIYKLGDSGAWEKIGEPRVRSKIRSRIAKLWSRKPVLVLGLLAPFMVIFNLVSVLAARPQHLYREICLLRSKQADPELMIAAIAEYQYMADYFSNMSLAFLTIFLLELSAIPQFLHWHTALAVLAAIYGMSALSYMLSRIAKISVDHAIFGTISKMEETR